VSEDALVLPVANHKVPLVVIKLVDNQTTFCFKIGSFGSLSLSHTHTQWVIFSLSLMRVTICGIISIIDFQKQPERKNIGVNIFSLISFSDLFIISPVLDK